MMKRKSNLGKSTKEYHGSVFIFRPSSVSFKLVHLDRSIGATRKQTGRCACPKNVVTISACSTRRFRFPIKSGRQKKKKGYIPTILGKLLRLGIEPDLILSLFIFLFPSLRRFSSETWDSVYPAHIGRDSIDSTNGVVSIQSTSKLYNEAR